MTETEATMTAVQVRDRLTEIAPCPDGDAVDATALAKWLAVRASMISRQQLDPAVAMDPKQIDLLTILFAAAHALYALDQADRAHAEKVATEIRQAWDDGGGVGEWLWEHLGDAVSREVGVLADAQTALRKPPAGLMEHYDVIRSALQLAALAAKEGSQRDGYVKALTALEREAAK